jgi:purine nucleoside permease
VLVLRSASDFSVPYPGQTAAQLLAADSSGTGYSAFLESLQDVYLTRSLVVNEIVDNWSTPSGSGAVGTIAMVPIAQPTGRIGRMPPLTTSSSLR